MHHDLEHLVLVGMGSVFAAVAIQPLENVTILLSLHLQQLDEVRVLVISVTTER